MKIQAAILDFDGTITTRDMADVLAAEVGKQAESTELNRQFHEGLLTGITGLVQRVNFLKGMTRQQLREIVARNDYLRSGARELFEFCKTNGIVTIIASGSTIPFLEIYQQKLGADYLVGSKPHMQGDTIDYISEHDYSGVDFKVRDTKAILEKLNIPFEATIAIGDSPADKGLFEFAGASIAIEPRSGVEAFANHVIADDLSRAIPIIERLQKP